MIINSSPEVTANPGLKTMTIPNGCRDCYVRQLGVLAEFVVDTENERRPATILKLACPILGQLGVPRPDRTSTTDTDATEFLAPRCAEQGNDKFITVQLLDGPRAADLLANVYAEFAPRAQLTPISETVSIHDETTLKVA